MSFRLEPGLPELVTVRTLFLSSYVQLTEFPSGMVKLGPNRKGVNARKGNYLIAAKPNLLNKKDEKTSIESALKYLPSADAKIGKDVIIEPFTTINKNVEIGEGTWISSNVTIMEGARIGKNCKIFPGAVISAIPQDLKFDGEVSIVSIGLIRLPLDVVM